MTREWRIGWDHDTARLGSQAAKEALLRASGFAGMQNERKEVHFIPSLRRCVIAVLSYDIVAC